MALDTIPKQEGGKLKAVASGTLPSGQPVIVNADGTVSVVALENISENVGTPAAFDSTTGTSEIDVVYDSGSQKVVVSYRDGSDSTRGYASVGTVSGNSISFGTPVRFTTRTIEWSSCTYDSVNEKVVMAYADQASPRYGYAIVGTVSGTSISFGTETVFNSYEVQHVDIGYDAGAGKVVIAYEDWGNSNRGTAIVGTVSGTSITFGTEVVYETSRTQKPSIVYDSNAQKTVILFSTYANSEYVQGIVGTVSGTSISFGTKTQAQAAVPAEIESTYDSSVQKIVAVYRNQSNSNYGTAVVGTVSGTSISFGTPVVFADGYVAEIGATYDASVGKIVITYRDVANSSLGKLVLGTVSGTSVSFGTPVEFNSVSARYTSVTYDANAKKSVIAFKDGGGSGEGEALVYQAAGSATNLTSENYIGISDGAIKTFSQSEALGTESTFETGNVYGSASGYHVAEKKTLLMFRDQSDSGKIKARLVTTTGTTLSYGSIVELTGQVGYPKSIVYDSVNEKLVVTFRGNTNYAYAVVATISGSSLTFGTPVVFNSATSSVAEGVYDSASGKIVVTYALSSVSYLKVGTVSGTSITFGSATSLGSGSGMYDGALAYDSVNGKTIFSQVNDITSDGVAYVGTVSGTSISVGSPTTFNSNLAAIYGSFYDSLSGKIGFIVQTGGGPGEGYVGTVSGTSISFGSGVQFQSSVSQGTAGYDSRVNKFIVASRQADAPNAGLLRVGTISGDTFSFASPVTFNTGETALNNHGVGFDSDQGTSIISFMDGGDGDVGKAIGFQAAGSYEVIGSVADGDNATVDIIGSLSTNQSGLTAGQQYYVQTDGTIGTTPADPSVLAGTAVSATKMVVKS